MIGEKFIQRTCNLTSISDYILNYTVEAFIIIFGLVVLAVLLGLIWLIRKLYTDIVKY
jgi:hypothetical protein